MSPEPPNAPEGTPEEDRSTQEQTTRPPEHGVPVTETDQSAVTVAQTGRRQAFQNLRRQLTEPELANSGVQKLLLDQLDRADSECERLTGYVERFHDADKRSAVLEEILRTQTGFDIIIGAGIAAGSAIMGLSSSFWDKTEKGPICLAVGAFLLTGSVVARLFGK